MRDTHRVELRHADTPEKLDRPSAAQPRRGEEPSRDQQSRLANQPRRANSKRLPSEGTEMLLLFVTRHPRGHTS